MRERVIDLLERTGPLTGAEIHEALGGETFAVWKACMLSPRLVTRRVGRRYLRVDRRVDGYARLSPSVLREFLTYTVVGLSQDPAAIELREQELQDHVKNVSQKKLELATRIVADVAARFTVEADAEKRFCAVLAGDIVYEMAHDVNRPERSTGAMVRGSDLDIVVIVSDDASGELVTQLDRAIYQEKFRYLKNPAFREEIDYVVKRFSKLREQAEFDTIQRMVACKIFDEAVLLCGSTGLFAAGKALLSERGLIDRLRAMEESAIRAREQDERHLLTTDEQVLRGEDSSVFCNSDEAEEFE
jgi:hypothetical protein